jgi:hypothetical protein
MPALTPSFLPPFPVVENSPSAFSSSKKVTSLGADSQKSIPPISPQRDTATQRVDGSLQRERALRMPSMKLDVPAIQEDMAASLAVALLGHVLFLKSQVPLCVLPLSCT